MPPAGDGSRRESTRGRLRVVFRFARLALLARCADGPWWALDDWHPRCDPRIPLSDREPQANYGCSPGQISQPWLREAVKWYLGTMLESGALRWTTVSQERLKCLARFSRWLTGGSAIPAASSVTPLPRPGRRQRSPAGPRTRRPVRQRPAAPETAGPQLVNDDLRAVAELFAFVAASPAEARRVLGPSPWDGVTEAHAASWYRQVTRIPHQPVRTDIHYVDDHALAQILAALPLLGMPRGQQMTITRGDGTEVTARGLDDPQAMRMILLQILTGRRASEVRTCDHDCLSAVAGPAGENGEVTRFRYAQSKIDIAPDTILVDREVTAVIEEQQAWLRGNFPGFPRRHLFIQRIGNRNGSKPYASGSYNAILREFSDLAGFTDSKGRPVRLSHTHRFRHTRLTRLAELGLPVHVLQRYAGHATPTMTLHYIAQREEHAEQAFLAAAKLKADGTRVTFSREDHDAIHLLGRADRILPNGWCLLPPLQTCGKGNACLTCAVYRHGPAPTSRPCNGSSPTPGPSSTGPATTSGSATAGPCPAITSGSPSGRPSTTRSPASSPPWTMPRTGRSRAPDARPHRRPGRSRSPSTAASHERNSRERHPRPPHRRPRRRGQGQVRGESSRRRPGHPPPGQERRARHFPVCPARGRRVPRVPLRKRRAPRPDRTAP